MATRTVKKWTRESLEKAIEKARSKQEFVQVPGPGGNLAITGAKNRWKTRPNVVYVQTLRVAGDSNEIRAALAGLGYDARTVEQDLANAITSTNYETTLRAVYEQEKTLRESSRGVARRTTVTGSAFLLRDLEDMVKTLKETGPKKAPGAKSPRRKAKSPKRKAKSPRRKAKSPKRKTTGTRGRSVKGLRKSPGRKASPKRKARSRSRSRSRSPRKSPKRVVDLRARLSKVGHGQVLDVSKLTATGAGSKIISRPTKGKKKSAHGVSVVSDNKRTFRMAMKRLGPEYEQYVEVFGVKAGTGSSAASGSPRLSPLPAQLTGGLALPTTTSALNMSIGSPGGSPLLR